jgi:tetratricopeptide (TPR) repeat protein
MKIRFFIYLIIVCSGVLLAQDPRENFKFAKFNYDKGEFGEALKFLNHAINAYYLRAETYYELKQYYNAVIDINKILKLDNTQNSFSGDYYLTRGKAFLALDDIDNADADFEKSIALTANNAQGHYYLARLRYVTRNFEEALTELESAIAINSKNAAFYALKAEIKMEYYRPVSGSQEYRDILSDINMALAYDPENYQYYEMRSRFLANMGEREKALEDYDTMIKLSPKKDDAYTNRGLMKMNQYEYREAVLDFTRSILLNPEVETNYRYRGLCYNNLNNYKEAYKDFSRSIDLLKVELERTAEKEKIQNMLAETYILRGHCLNLMGSNSQACRDFLMAHNLGVKKGLNYYRKYCGLY